MNTAKHRVDDLYLSGLTADLFYHEASKIMEEHAVRCGSIVIDMPLQNSEPEDAVLQPYSEPDIIFRPERDNEPMIDEDNLELKNARGLPLGPENYVEDLKDEKPTMNLYRWGSRLPRAYGNADIIVMAESLDQAREFARIQGRKYLHEHNRLNEDPEYDFGLDEELRVLEADLSNEPELIPSGAILIRGSD